MSQEAFIVHFFWGPRKESFKSGARRLRKFLTTLACMDPLFRKWQIVGKNFPDNEPIGLTEKTLLELCKRGISRSELPPFTPIVDLGFRVHVATQAKWVLCLAVNCGCYSEYVSNSLIMDLPFLGPPSKRIYRACFLEKFCQVVVECWDPDCGQIWSHQLSDKLNIPQKGVEVGWLTYVPARLSVVPRLKPPLRIVPAGKSGAIIVTTTQGFSSENPSHVERAKIVVDALNGPLHQLTMNRNSPSR